MPHSSVFFDLNALYINYIADPPFVDIIINVLRARPVKSNPEELSFSEVNLSFLLVIIVLSILCLSLLIIGITVIICRWIFHRKCTVFSCEEAALEVQK